MYKIRKGGIMPFEKQNLKQAKQIGKKQFFKYTALIIPLGRYASGIRCCKFCLFRIRFETKGKMTKEMTSSKQEIENNLQRKS